MVWGAISSLGPLVLRRIQGRMTAQTYLQILRDEVQPFFTAHPDFIYQQDNATPHKARVTMRWFEEEAIEVLEWPPCSPDLNPIENCWSYIKIKLDREIIHGQENVLHAAQRHFTEMTPEFIANLINWMQNRCRQVINRNGLHADY